MCAGVAERVGGVSAASCRAAPGRPLPITACARSSSSARARDRIVSDSMKNIDKFIAQIDSAAVMVNASTRFTDGAEFGFGAEIGISNQKLHARGPMGLVEMNSTKYVVRGKGHIRGKIGEITK